MGCLLDFACEEAAHAAPVLAPFGPAYAPVVGIGNGPKSAMLNGVCPALRRPGFVKGARRGAL
jgi:hypothetical protein